MIAPVECGEWPLNPLFFEVPKTSLERRKIFIGRKWLFREMLENLSSDLPTSGGIVIHGGSATGKTSVILNLVQGSCFGQRGKTRTYIHTVKLQFSGQDWSAPNRPLFWSCPLFLDLNFPFHKMTFMYFVVLNY